MWSCKTFKRTQRVQIQRVQQRPGFQVARVCLSLLSLTDGELAAGEVYIK